MKRTVLITLMGFVLITLLDIVGSIASRQMNFNYSDLLPIPFLIYIAIPFLIVKRGNKRTAIISGGFLGLFDATIGQKLSILLQANTGDFDINSITPSVFIVTAMMMSVVGCLCGLFGYWLSIKFSGNKTTR